MNNLLRLPQVIDRTGLSRSYIYDGIAKGSFPRPVKITPRTSAWVESEVQEWIDRRIADRDGKPGASLRTGQGT